MSGSEACNLPKVGNLKLEKITKIAKIKKIAKMISHLAGKIIDCSEKRICVMTAGGVGYEVFPAGSLLATCRAGGEFSAEIHTIVRETEISLYGFGHPAERTLFQKCLAVSGIGPKLAIQIVSTPIDAFLGAVESGDVDFLKRIPGLGKKTAEKLIIELRGKLDLAPESAPGAVSPQMNDALDALENLGYDRQSAQKKLKSAPENSTTEDLIKFYLNSNV